ncbi:conserved hypothetical protein [Ricinus communis]|uniref:Uncharacterized protein n=1 Tax=Ricinus communis TaxID=3988 RepID=B9TFV1_RICCO|nr:conserved hypothetical protein [Ricinus communis]
MLARLALAGLLVAASAHAADKTPLRYLQKIPGPAGRRAGAPAETPLAIRGAAAQAADGGAGKRRRRHPVQLPARMAARRGRLDPRLHSDQRGGAVVAARESAGHADGPARTTPWHGAGLSLSRAGQIPRQ